MLAHGKESDRGKAFMRRCKLVGVSGLSLHSYRYAWAERARCRSWQLKPLAFRQRRFREKLGSALETPSPR